MESVPMRDDAPAAPLDLAAELDRHLPAPLRGRPQTARLETALRALVAAATPDEGLEAISGLLSWTRRRGGAFESLEENAGAAEGGRAAARTARLRLLLGLFERSAPLGDRFAEVVGDLVLAADASHLFGEVGIPAGRGFLAELGERIMQKLLPRRRDAADLTRILLRLYRNDEHVGRLIRLPLPLFQRLAARVAPSGEAADWARVRAGMIDGFRLVHLRLQAEALGRHLRVRAGRRAVPESPFFRLGELGAAIADAAAAGAEVAAAAAAWRELAVECRAECAAILAGLEETGVSVDVVFGLEAVGRCLTRLEAILAVLEAPLGERRAAAVHRLLGQLASAAVADRSVRALLRANLRLLYRKIVDRSGSTGEHYVARDRADYRNLVLAAVGGGLLTVGTAAIKTAVHTWHLPPFPEGLLYSLNYAVSFLLLQRFHLVLATKQPAMTAATLAGILREHQKSERAEEIVDFAARITSSQLAAAAGNVVTVALGCYAFSEAWQLLLNRPWLTPEQANEVLVGLSPLDSGTVFYAALTGVLLWLASIAGGWLGNWGAYYEVPQAVAQHPLRRRLGAERLERWARSVHDNLSGWGTNVVLGFLLGLTPAIGRFLGLPLDVRHVTLNSGILSIAAVSSGRGPEGLAWLPRALAGVAVMFVLNLGVSFLLSLYTAARAYGFSASDVRALLGAWLRRARQRPGDFVLPPRG